MSQPGPPRRLGLDLILLLRRRDLRRLSPGNASHDDDPDYPEQQLHGEAHPYPLYLPIWSAPNAHASATTRMPTSSPGDMFAPLRHEHAPRGWRAWRNRDVRRTAGPRPTDISLLEQGLTCGLTRAGLAGAARAGNRVRAHRDGPLLVAGEHALVQGDVRLIRTVVHRNSRRDRRSPTGRHPSWQSRG